MIIGIQLDCIALVVKSVKKKNVMNQPTWCRHGQRNLHIDVIGCHDESSWYWIDPGIQFWASNQIHDPQLGLIVAHVQLLRKHAVHLQEHQNNKLYHFKTKFLYGQ